MLKTIFVVQHLYFIVAAAPALFLPLVIVLLNSQLLPRLFGYLAVILAVTFSALGIAFQLRLVLPSTVTAFADVRTTWWLVAAITLIARSGTISQVVERESQKVVLH